LSIAFFVYFVYNVGIILKLIKIKMSILENTKETVPYIPGKAKTEVEKMMDAKNEKKISNDIKVHTISADNELIIEGNKRVKGLEISLGKDINDDNNFKNVFVDHYNKLFLNKIKKLSGRKPNEYLTVADIDNKTSKDYIAEKQKEAMEIYTNIQKEIKEKNINLEDEKELKRIQDKLNFNLSHPKTVKALDNTSKFFGGLFDKFMNKANSGMKLVGSLASSVAGFAKKSLNAINASMKENKVIDTERKADVPGDEKKMGLWSILKKNFGLKQEQMEAKTKELEERMRIAENIYVKKIVDAKLSALNKKLQFVLTTDKIGRLSTEDKNKLFDLEDAIDNELTMTNNADLKGDLLSEKEATKLNMKFYEVFNRINK